MLPACFPFHAGHCLQSNSGLCAPFLTQGQGQGGPESPHTCLPLPPCPFLVAPDLPPRPPGSCPNCAASLRLQWPELGAAVGAAARRTGSCLPSAGSQEEAVCPEAEGSRGLTKMITGEMKRQQIWKKKGGGNPNIISMSWK